MEKTETRTREELELAEAIERLSSKFKFFIVQDGGETYSGEREIFKSENFEFNVDRYLENPEEWENEIENVTLNVCEGEEGISVYYSWCVERMGTKVPEEGDFIKITGTNTNLEFPEFVTKETMDEFYDFYEVPDGEWLSYDGESLDAEDLDCLLRKSKNHNLDILVRYIDEDATVNFCGSAEEFEQEITDEILPNVIFIG